MQLVDLVWGVGGHICLALCVNLSSWLSVSVSVWVCKCVRRLAHFLMILIKPYVQCNCVRRPAYVLMTSLSDLWDSRVAGDLPISLRLSHELKITDSCSLYFGNSLQVWPLEEVETRTLHTHCKNAVKHRRRNQTTTDGSGSSLMFVGCFLQTLLGASGLGACPCTLACSVFDLSTTSRSKV